LDTYGIRTRLASQLQYDCAAFALRLPIDNGVPTRLNLFKRISDALCPGYFEWNDWTRRMLTPMCEGEHTALAGCAGAGKTYNVAGFIATWWLASPMDSSAIICSTALKDMRKKIWAEIQKYHTSIPGPRIGNFLNTSMTWQARKGDDKHAIIGVAVEQGGSVQAATRIQGHHTPRQLVFIEEATAIRKAIFDAVFNLSSYAQEFLLILAANPHSKLDEFGRFCEPANGWSSVTVDNDEWESVPHVGGKPATVVRLDAEKSPNVLLDQTVSKWLPTKARVQSRRRELGGVNSPLYWSYERGFWPPDGALRTILSESILSATNADKPATFTGADFQILGALDQAWGGGDRPVLRFAKFGRLSSGKLGFESLPPITLELDVKSPVPIRYQLLNLTRAHCQSVTVNGIQYHCPPENLVIDNSGDGGLGDIMHASWSPNVMRVVFNNSPSDDPCSAEDPRPASSVYHNKRAEMYFRTRNGVLSSQIFGIDPETAAELCTIEYDDSGRKLTIASKKDYRLHYAKSPDDSDSLVLLTEIARSKGMRIALPRSPSSILRTPSPALHAAAVFDDMYAPDECIVINDTDHDPDPVPNLW
jgi:hypothetical protein